MTVLLRMRSAPGTDAPLLPPKSFRSIAATACWLITRPELVGRLMFIGKRNDPSKTGFPRWKRVVWNGREVEVEGRGVVLRVGAREKPAAGAAEDSAVNAHQLPPSAPERLRHADTPLAFDVLTDEDLRPLAKDEIAAVRRLNVRLLAEASED